MNNLTEYDEKLLLRQIVQGEEPAFETLFHKWRDKLYFFILRITSSQQTAEDVALEERRLELFFEGQRAGDLFRNNRPMVCAIRVFIA